MPAFPIPQLGVSTLKGRDDNPITFPPKNRLLLERSRFEVLREFIIFEQGHAS